ncbi:unnamed protein product [Prunus armeniaca]
MVAKDTVRPHFVAGRRLSNLREDVLLVPLGMLRKHVDVRVRRRDKWGRPTKFIEDNGSGACRLVMSVERMVQDRCLGKSCGSSRPEWCNLRRESGSAESEFGALVVKCANEISRREPRMPWKYGSAGAQTNGGAVDDTRLAFESCPGGVHLFKCGKCIMVLCGPWSEEKRIFLYGVVMQQCSGHVDKDFAIISGGECHGSHISECYRDSEVDSVVGHVDEDVDTISGGECHRSHIDKCYRDSVGTSMRLRGSLSVKGRELIGVGRVAFVKGYFSEHPYDMEVVIRTGIRLLKDNLCLRGKGIPEDTRHLTILDRLGLGSALSKMEGRYSDAGKHELRPYAMHRWLRGTFGIHMSPRLGRHASMTTCVYSLRMWAIVDPIGMTNRSVVDVSYATLDVWASRVRCRMRSDCIVTRDPGPHGCALSGEICVWLLPRRVAHSSCDTWQR